LFQAKITAITQGPRTIWFSTTWNDKSINRDDVLMWKEQSNALGYMGDANCTLVDRFANVCFGID
jgi:hypothetical protein